MLVCAVAHAGCGGPDFYEVCEAPDDCEDVAPEGAAAECVEKEGGGFCAWTCATDTDCDDDQDDRYDFLCAPFESNPETYCFPACAGEDEECPDGYTCRSTGGGEENEKICFPA